MKMFSIRLPKQNIDPTGSLKNRILQAVNEKLPFAKWYGIHTDDDPKFNISHAGPNDLLCFGMNPHAEFSAINSRFFKPDFSTEKCCNCPFTKIPFKLRQYDASSELDLALERLSKYAKFLEDYEEDPGYDFIYMGKPVRIYQKFIQIGNTIIPTENPKSYLKNIDNNKNIINFIINISKSEEIVNIINKFE